MGDRSRSMSRVMNIMWFLYFAIPLLLGLLNVYVLKLRWEPSQSKVFKNFVTFLLIPCALQAAVCAYLTWGVGSRYDSVVYGVPCSEGLEWPKGPLGPGECSPPRSPLEHFAYLMDGFQNELWMLVVWAISSYPCCSFVNSSFFAIYVAGGWTMVRFLLTECPGIPFAMRTINLNYDGKNWMLNTPVIVRIDLLTYLLFFCLFRR